MKTTVEISDALLEAAKAEAAQRGTTLRSLLEEGLRRVLELWSADRDFHRFPAARVRNPLVG